MAKPIALVKQGLPFRKTTAAVTVAPHSHMVGASCLLFASLSVYAVHWGDSVTSVALFLQTLFSFGADYLANFQAGPARSGPFVLKRKTAEYLRLFDRAMATTVCVWLAQLASFHFGPVMIFALIPPIFVIGVSRASESRDVWVVRHSCWHVFAMLYGAVVMSAIYQSDEDGELLPMLGTPTSAVELAAIARLTLIPMLLGFIVIVMGLSSEKFKSL
jgi:hypothetical protein